MDTGDAPPSCHGGNAVNSTTDLHQDATDITLNHAFSKNQIPVAGRKRAREELDDTSYKRARQNGE